jgi:hypothetical protein
LAEREKLLAMKAQLAAVSVSNACTWRWLAEVAEPARNLYLLLFFAASESVSLPRKMMSDESGFGRWGRLVRVARSLELQDEQLDVLLKLSTPL